MIVRSKILRLFGVVLPLLCPQIGWTQNLPKDMEQTAQLLTAFLNAGRLVVDRHQSVINDPGKGDKGFTPEVFEQLVCDEFFQQTRIDVRHPSSSLPSLARELSAAHCSMTSFGLETMNKGAAMTGRVMRARRDSTRFTTRFRQWQSRARCPRSCSASSIRPAALWRIGIVRRSMPTQFRSVLDAHLPSGFSIDTTMSSAYARGA